MGAMDRAAGSPILAAVLLKLGTYGFIRIAIPILPQAAQSWAPWIGLLAARSWPPSC